jgi:hypothetical protein
MRPPSLESSTSNYTHLPDAHKQLGRQKPMAAGKKLSAAEKRLVIKTYEYIRAKKAAAPHLWKGDTRNHVHECLGFAKNTISSIWAHWEKHHDPNFSSVGRRSICCCYIT